VCLVARGDCQTRIQEAAAANGINLGKQSLNWLCQQGHLGLPDKVLAAAKAVERIYIVLRGNLSTLSATSTQEGLLRRIRDLATPAMGHPPLIRIDVPHRNGRAAYREHQNRLLRHLSPAAAEDSQNRKL